MPVSLSDHTRTSPSENERSSAWFCLRIQPKHEHIAEAHLLQKQIPVFNPRIRFRRSTRQGQVSVTESLFPGYVFARLQLQPDLAQIRYLPGIRDVVHFGPRWPTIPDEVMSELQTIVGPEKVHQIPPEFAVGDEVKISGGPFHGLQAVVSRLLPARERIIILLEFLGRQTTVEIQSEKVVQERAERLFLKSAQPRTPSDA